MRSKNGKARTPSPQLTSERTKDLTFRSMVRTLGLLDRAMQPYFTRFGITGSQWGVLRALNKAESEGLTGLRLTDLGERLIIRPPSVTGVIDRLERQALVVRENVAGDLRAKQVRMTPKARLLVSRILVGYCERLDEVLGGLTDAEHTELHRLHSTLSSHIELIANSGSQERLQASRRYNTNYDR